MQRRHSSHLCAGGRDWHMKWAQKDRLDLEMGNLWRAVAVGRALPRKGLLAEPWGRGERLSFWGESEGRKSYRTGGGVWTKTWTMNIVISFRFFLGQMECHLHRSQLPATLPQLFIFAFRPCLCNWAHTTAFTCVIPRPPITQLHSWVVPLEDFRTEFFWVREVARVQHWTRMVLFLLLLSDL